MQPNAGRGARWRGKCGVFRRWARGRGKCGGSLGLGLGVRLRENFEKREAKEVKWFANYHCYYCALRK